jgi:hypothetical protein
MFISLQKKKSKVFAGFLVFVIIFYLTFGSFIFAPPAIAVTAPFISANVAGAFDTTDPGTSGTFAPPDNSLVLVLTGSDEGTAGVSNPLTITNSGGAFTWTQIAVRNVDDSGGLDGQAAAWYGMTTSSRPSMTVTVSIANVTQDIDVKVYVIKNYDRLDPIGASREGSFTDNASSSIFAYNSTTANSRSFFVANDWSANGAPTSADVEDSYHQTGQISGLEAYKLNSTPTIGTAVTFDLDGGGTGAAEWNWVAFEVNGYGPTFTLNAYRWYMDTNAIDPTDKWGITDIAQNTAITVLPFANYAPTSTVELRLRVNLTIGTTTFVTNTMRFRLQYKNGTDGDCTTGSWTNVGENASTTFAWTYATSTLTDRTTTTVSGLSPASDVLDMYLKSTTSTATTTLNKRSAYVGQEVEFDFHILNNSATSSVQHSFRVTEYDGTVFTAYTVCPTLTTAPTIGDEMRHGNFFTDEVEQGFYWVDSSSSPYTSS